MSRDAARLKVRHVFDGLGLSMRDGWTALSVEQGMDLVRTRIAARRRGSPADV